MDSCYASIFHVACQIAQDRRPFEWHSPVQGREADLVSLRSFLCSGGFNARSEAIVNGNVLIWTGTDREEQLRLQRQLGDWHLIISTVICCCGPAIKTKVAVIQPHIFGHVLILHTNASKADFFQFALFVLRTE